MTLSTFYLGHCSALVYQGHAGFLYQQYSLNPKLYWELVDRLQLQVDHCGLRSLVSGNPHVGDMFSHGHATPGVPT